MAIGFACSPSRLKSVAVVRIATWGIALVAGCLLGSPPGLAQPVVRKLTEQVFTPAAGAGGDRALGVHRTYFRNGTLAFSQQLFDSVYSDPCDWVSATIRIRNPSRHAIRTLLMQPRVDEITCHESAAAGFSRSVSLLLGLDSEGKRSWQRLLIHKTGDRELPLTIVGAASTGIVLSSLEVLSPASGDSLLAPALRSIAAENRTVPVHDFVYPTIYRPSTNSFFSFDPSGHTGAAPGIVAFRAATGERRLLVPLRHAGVGSYQVESLALLDPPGILLIGERLERRGPSHVAFRAVDADSGRELYSERLGRECFCSETAIAVGEGGNVAFVYWHADDGHYVVVHYQITTTS